jgi:Protein of unknown function (DUF1592)/Protein of unknown function (DUF1588)/Protein of unknown function (DUF1595)/Protein of unknown function (DUF1585)/Protein of unknown function (DUF1587)
VLSLRNLTIGALCATLVGGAVLGGVGCSSTTVTKPDKPAPLPEGFVPTDAPIRRLLARQYVNAVQAFFGDAAASAADPPEDQELNGFQSIAAAQLSLNDTLVANYERSARAVAAAATANPDSYAAFLDCEPTGANDVACLTSFVERFGRRAFRRPLVDEEVADYVDLGSSAADTLGSFEQGIEFVIVGMLQSPQFLFQIELGLPNDDVPGVHRLNGYEVATRMSLFLLDTPPDDALLDAAAAGELNDIDAIRSWATELVNSEPARAATRSFFEEYLVLGEMDQVAKSPELFPEFSTELAEAMKEETMRLLEDIIYQRDVAITEAFTADYSVVNDLLAAHYGMMAPHDSEWTLSPIPAGQGRRGILGHASLASVHSHPDSTSVTFRGLFVIERFLCTSMPPPPEGVVPELPPSSVAPTMRERVAVHLEDESCAACHAATDPIGLALEQMDPIGRWRTTENGADIDATAEHYILGEFDGIAGLGDALARTDAVTACMLRQLYRYATGHVEIKSELPALEQLHTSFARGGKTFKGMLVELVSSEVFRTVLPPAGALEPPGGLVIEEEETP